MNITSGRLHACSLPLAYYIFLLRRKCYRIRIRYCIIALSIVYVEFKLHLIDRRDSVSPYAVRHILSRGYFAAILSRISVHNMALPVTGIRKYLRSKAVVVTWLIKLF